MTLDGFFVWNPERNRPDRQHSTRKDAIAEASRLARTHLGETFVVLEVVGHARVVVPDVFTPSPSYGTEEIPF